MDKEKILELSREENERQDEMERKTISSANNAAFIVGAFVSVIILWLHLFFEKQPNFSVFTVFFSMMATTHIVQYRKTKRTVNLIFVFLSFFISVIFFVLYLKSIFR